MSNTKIKKKSIKLARLARLLLLFGIIYIYIVLFFILYIKMNGVFIFMRVI
jgi:hypothetical protein